MAISGFWAPILNFFSTKQEQGEQQLLSDIDQRWRRR